MHAVWRRLLVLAATTILCALPAGSRAASSGITSLRTPSRNIYCAWEHVGGTPQVFRCDVRQLAHKPAKPRSCHFDYGSSFGMNARGRAAPLCVSDTVFDPHAKVLPYGHSRRLGPFSCKSLTTGLRCKNQSGHGFLLNRDRYKLF
jgi:hypothetical protein